LWSVAYGAGRFAAVGQNGLLLSSTNGSVWEPQISGTTNTLSGVAFANGLFVAGGDHGTLLTSVDAQTWVTRDSAAGDSDLYGVGFGNGVYVVAGEDGAIVTSSDGEHWTARPSGITSQLLAVTYGNGQFVAVGPSGTILQSATLLGTQLAVSVSSAGSAQLTLSGQPGSSYGLQISFDFQTWTTITNLMLTNASGIWRDPSAITDHKFYRAVIQ
jgi:hypothetical protein